MLDQNRITLNNNLWRFFLVHPFHCLKNFSERILLSERHGLILMCSGFKKKFTTNSVISGKNAKKDNSTLFMVVFMMSTKARDLPMQVEHTQN